MNHITETAKLSLYPDTDYSTIANCELYVYFHQMRMDILLDGISYVGIWRDGEGELLISVSDEHTEVEDGKIYQFDGHCEETQHPQEIADFFIECARQIMLDQAEDYEAPRREFPTY